jgi:sugar phosphate isomerase/epimerase
MDIFSRIRAQLYHQRLVSVIIILSILDCYSSFAQSPRNVVGIIAPLENDSMLYAAGFRLTGTTVGTTLSPTLSEQDFSRKIEQIKKNKCDVYLCNVLFPGSLKIAGPDVNESEVLGYLEKVLARAERAGIRNLTLGSGGARRLPDSYNVMKATDDFILLARKMAGLAKQHRVTIILENLNRTETNFITRLSDAAEVVRKVDHPNFRLNADIYHMLMEDESPMEIENAGGLIVYCEIAEKKARSLPGVNKEDFRPYLSALKKIHYKGPIVIEGNSDQLNKDAPAAFQYLMNQLRDVERKKQR